MGWSCSVMGASKQLDALAQMRLWLPGKFLASVAASEQVGLEHFRRCSEAEALARRGVQASTEGAQFFLRQAVRIGVAAEPSSETLVGILHGPFLPG